MKPIPEIYRWVAVLVGSAAASMVFLYFGGAYLFSMWQGDRNHVAEFRNLHHENQQLRQDIELLKVRYQRLRNRLDTYAPRDLRYSDMADQEKSIDPTTPLRIPEGLLKEGIDAQHAFRRLVLEKHRWDRFLQNQYKDILETAIEPVLMEHPSLADKENLKMFDELAASLRLHEKLIRDVRIFHSEIQFEQKHPENDFSYKAYDYKLRLDPFARESSIADAMQQALSALSTGVYHQEAVEVLDRLGDEFTRPVRQEYERLLSVDDASAPSNYNYNIFLTFGKKIMDYAEMLAGQTSVPLASKALGELDYLHRRLQQSFRDLHEIGQHETIDAALLDMEELERTIQ
ncbi:MAG: hypothetical protein ABFS43_17595 [Thermodesulfobacteriota bacterium]